MGPLILWSFILRFLYHKDCFLKTLLGYVNKIMKTTWHSFLVHYTKTFTFDCYTQKVEDKYSAAVF